MARGRIDYARRLKAFELFAAGLKPVAIAKELGTSRQCINNWKVADKWDDRLYKAEISSEFAGENKAAEILDAFKGRLRKRLGELELLCSNPDPKVKLAAIKTWFQLTDLLEKKGSGAIIPSSLSLDDDLTEESSSVGVPIISGEPESGEPSGVGDVELPRAPSPVHH